MGFLNEKHYYSTSGSGKQGLFWEETRARPVRPGLWISLWIMLITGSLGSLGVLVGQEPNNSVYLAP
jgi:hypothetical protein